MSRSLKASHSNTDRILTLGILALILATGGFSLLRRRRGSLLCLLLDFLFAGFSGPFVIAAGRRLRPAAALPRLGLTPAISRFAIMI